MSSFRANMEKLKKDHPKAGDRWTLEEDAKLLREIASIKSIEEIAAEHGRTVGGITSRLVQKAIDDLNSCATYDDVTKRYRVTEAQIKKAQAKQAASESRESKALLAKDTLTVLKEQSVLLTEIRDLMKQLVDKK